MRESQAFWSYVHSDDLAEGGRIARLAKDVVAQVEMLTGEPLTIFLDSDAIKWGEAWREKIDESLANVACFVPVLTPRYFMSAECRRELQVFARAATRLGFRELVLPLLYADVPGLDGTGPPDDLVDLIRGFQWEDWREQRFADCASGDYRRGVARLAKRIVDANRHAEIKGETVILPSPVPEEAEPRNEEPAGLLDHIAAAEESLPKVTSIAEGFGSDLALIGRLAEEASKEIDLRDKQGGTFGTRLLVFRKLANELGEPVERMWSRSGEFLAELNRVDDGFRPLIQQVASEAKDDASTRKNACEFFTTVRGMAANARGGLGSLEQMIGKIQPLESMSRDLRPVLRRLRQALTRMLEARDVTDEWVSLVDRSGVPCEDGNRTELSA
jgi:hypothetical protein